MTSNQLKHQGFSIIELMIAGVIGVLLSLAILQIYVVQTQLYKTSNSQSLIQSTENAINNLVTPVIRSSGFIGCGAISSAISNLNAGGSNPVGSINTNPTSIIGYSGGTASSMTLQANPVNDGNAGNWTPSLDPALAGNAINGSDVIVVLGAVPGSMPLSITSIISTGTLSFTLQGTNGYIVSPNQLAAVSDCGKAVLFIISNLSGTTVTFSSGVGTLQNSSSTLPVDFRIGAQFIPIQQTAFFVGQGQGGQSALMRATLSGNTWSTQPIAPGVEIMKVLYGIGTNGIITQYVPANLVLNWSQVYAVRLGFLIAGQPSSGVLNNAAYNVLNTSVTAPADNRLRHVYEITINLRNSLS